MSIYIPYLYFTISQLTYFHLCHALIMQLNSFGSACNVFSESNEQF